MALTDKNAIMQVIGCLLHNPLLYGQIESELNIEDFDSGLPKIVVASIMNLYRLGSTEVSIIDVDNYIRQYNGKYADFERKGGIAYLQDCYDIAQEANFHYYFNRVKKFSALRMLDKAGFNIKNIYPVSVDDPIREREMQEAFDGMEVQAIFDSITKDLGEIEYKFNVGSSVSLSAKDGAAKLKEELKANPEIGAALQGDIYNVIVRGARKGKFYLNSGASGSGKSRKLIGNACKVAYPVRWDDTLGRWTTLEERCGDIESTLIITTELEKEEVQTIIMAYLSGVNEERILYGNYYGNEEERVDEAVRIMEEYPNLYIEAIPDPSIGQVKSVIKRHVAVNGIVNVFYDYIFSSPNLLGEFRDLKVREDVALMMLSTALKDMAVEFNLYVESGTQLSGDYENWEGVRNQTLIRGAKSIVDKCDVGAITSAVQQRDLDKLAPAIRTAGYPQPTHVIDIYKLRRGRYKNVRLWGIMDLGTGRWMDLFVTDGNYKPITISSPKVLFAGMVDFTAEEATKETISSDAGTGAREAKPASSKGKGWDYCL